MRTPWDGLPPRDPARIDRIIKKLHACWEQAPDTRLGQLVVCLSPLHSNIFNVEDDVIEAQLDEKLKELGSWQEPDDNGGDG